MADRLLKPIVGINVMLTNIENANKDEKALMRNIRKKDWTLLLCLPLHIDNMKSAALKIAHSLLDQEGKIIIHESSTWIGLVLLKKTSTKQKSEYKQKIDSLISKFSSNR